MVERVEENVAYCRCAQCREVFEEYLPEDDPRTAELMVAMLAKQDCPSCEESERAKEKARLFSAKLPEFIEKSGLPVGYQLTEPPIRFVAEWLWKNRTRNVLLSGITGTGKSTSAGVCALKLIERGERVRYVSLRELMDDWRNAKTSSKANAVEWFLESLGRLDLLIVDEVVNKANISSSGQELLFELIEGAYCKSRRNRIWLMGNFYRGAIKEIFSDPDPVLRRLSEKFVCGVILDGQVEPIRFDGKVQELLWQGEGGLTTDRHR